MKDLSKRDEIIIISEDKSGAVVIINVNDYIREAKCQTTQRITTFLLKTLQQLITTL